MFWADKLLNLQGQIIINQHLVNMNMVKHVKALKSAMTLLHSNKQMRVKVSSKQVCRVTEK